MGSDCTEGPTNGPARSAPQGHPITKSATNPKSTSKTDRRSAPGDRATIRTKINNPNTHTHLVSALRADTVSGLFRQLEPRLPRRHRADDSGGSAGMTVGSMQ
jgi:hypothetical protein